MTTLIQISAGTGPVEVRRFVARLATPLRIALDDAGCPIDAEIRHGDADAPRSLAFVLDGVEPDAPVFRPWLGTHCRIDTSRGRGARKRWYVGVSAIRWPSGTPPTLDPADLDVTACRAGGPGGQHVNKSETAVRIVHRPTGLQVRADRERSRAANHRAAEHRLASLLEMRAVGREARARDAAWRAHHHLERGRPVMTWRGVPLQRI